MDSTTKTRKKPSNKSDKMVERNRSSEMRLKITSYGNAEQHEKTLALVLFELDLRGFNVELVTTRPLP